MHLPKKLVVALIAGLMIAVPTIVVAATDTGISQQQYQYFYSSNGKGNEKAKTKNKKWTEVPGLHSAYGSFDGSLATVSAELKEGKAKFRIVNEDASVLTQPKSVLFEGAASSFTFPLVQNTSCSSDTIVEWKQVGKKPAVLGGSTLGVQLADGCP